MYFVSWLSWPTESGILSYAVEDVILSIKRAGHDSLVRERVI